MRKFLIILIALMAVLSPSCRSSKKATLNTNYTRSGSKSNNASKSPYTTIISDNIADMTISSQSISYTIDISTPEGQLKLKGINQEEAEELALTEAVIINKCAMLINPQYTFLKDGKDILRVTVFGFPAYYTKIRSRDDANQAEETEEVEVKTQTTTSTTTTKTNKPGKKSRTKKR